MNSFQTIRDRLLSRIRLHRVAQDENSKLRGLKDNQLVNRLEALHGQMGALDDQIMTAQQKLTSLEGAQDSPIGPDMETAKEFLRKSIKTMTDRRGQLQNYFQQHVDEYSRRNSEGWQPTIHPDSSQSLVHPKRVEEFKERTPQSEERKPEIFGKDSRNILNVGELRYDPETGWAVSVDEITDRIRDRVLSDLQVLEGDDPVLKVDRQKISRQRPQSLSRWMASNPFLDEVRQFNANPENDNAYNAVRKLYEEYKDEMEFRRTRRQSFTMTPDTMRKMADFIVNPKGPADFLGENERLEFRAGEHGQPQYLSGESTRERQMANKMIAEQLSKTSELLGHYRQALEARLDELRPRPGHPLTEQHRIDALFGKHMGDDRVQKLEQEELERRKQRLQELEDKAQNSPSIQERETAQYLLEQEKIQLQHMIGERGPTGTPKLPKSGKIPSNKGLNYILDAMANVMENALTRAAKLISTPENKVAPGGEGGTRLPSGQKTEVLPQDDPPSRKGSVPGEFAEGSEGHMWRWNAEKDNWVPQAPPKNKRTEPFYGGYRDNDSYYRLKGPEQDKNVHSFSKWVELNSKHPAVQKLVSRLMQGDRTLREKHDDPIRRHKARSARDEARRNLREMYQDYLDSQKKEQVEVGRAPGSFRGKYRRPKEDAPQPTEGMQLRQWARENKDNPEVHQLLLDLQNARKSRDNEGMQSAREKLKDLHQQSRQVQQERGVAIEPVPTPSKDKSLKEWVQENKGRPGVKKWLLQLQEARKAEDKEKINAVKEGLQRMKEDEEKIHLRKREPMPSEPEFMSDRPMFRWQGVDLEGRATSGTTSAINEDMLIRDLRQKGIDVTRVWRTTKKSNFVEDFISKLSARRKRRRDKSNLEEQYVPHGAELDPSTIPEEYRPAAATSSEDVMAKRRELQAKFAEEAREAGMPEPPMDLVEIDEELEKLQAAANEAGRRMFNDLGILPYHIAGELKNREQALASTREELERLELASNSVHKDPSTGDLVPVTMSPEERAKLENKLRAEQVALKQYTEHLNQLRMNEDVQFLLSAQQKISAMRGELEYKIEKTKSYLQIAEAHMKRPGTDNEKLQAFVERYEAYLGRQERLLDYKLQEGQEYLIGPGGGDRRGQTPGTEGDWRAWGDLPPRGMSPFSEKERSPYSARRVRQPHSKY